jgi:thiamine biosynthesis lipoprotein
MRPDSRVAGEQFKAATIRWVAEFEARYSRFLPDSLISLINQSAGQNWVELDEEADRSVCALSGIVLSDARRV